MIANGITCVVVADGLGGYTGGAAASRIAVDTVFDSFKKKPGFSKECIEQYISLACEAIRKKSKESPDNMYMSSTIAVLLINGQNAVWAHVGDSRLYRFENKMIAEVTDDHSIAFEDFMSGLIEYGEIRTSPNQNKLTNALSISPCTISVSDITPIDGSSSFLLCTDGWWEYVTEEEMEQTLGKASNSREWLRAMLDIRENAAPENSDNYTAAAVMM